MSSVQALISWTGFWRTQVENMKAAYRVAQAEYALIVACCALPIPEPVCKPMCVCAAKAVADIQRTVSKLSRYQRSLNSGWAGPDQAAGDQLRALQDAAVDIWQKNQKARDTYLDAQLGLDRPAKAVVSQAAGGGAWAGEWSSASVPVAVVNKSEANVLLDSRQLLNHHYHAAFASRGWKFTTSRNGGAVSQMVKMAWLFQQQGFLPDIPFLTNDGNAYWGPGLNHGTMNVRSVHGWADDHGMASVVFMRAQPPCIPLPGAWSSSERHTHLRATERNDQSDAHKYKDGRRGGDTRSEARQRHTLGTCSGNCPGMWSGFVDYDLGRLADPQVLFGQPSNLSIIQRNYQDRGERADPWNLVFRFRLTPQNPDTEFSNNGLTLMDGTNISRQTAIASGLAYYHRASYWQEPPNFLNPYWRATLVPISLDVGGGRTDTALTAAGVPWAAEARRALEMAGFKDYEKVQ
jgi:hypothetical protein